MKEEGGGGEGGNANRRLAWPILGTGSRVQSFPRALPLPNDVPVLLLNQPIVYSGRQDLPFLEFRSISRAAKPKIPFIDLSSLRNQTETLATHATKIYVSHTWIGCIRKRSYTEFGMPMLQKETPGSVNVCWKESAPWRPSFHLKITCYSHANELISIFVIVH